MATWAWVLIIVVAAVVVIALLAGAAARQRRTRTLRQQFGPEYERTMQERDNRRAAEADLRGREKQRAQLDITPLPEAARVRFAEEWHQVQERFVDQPSTAVSAADNLLTRVMQTRGYPVEDFDQQAGLVSVDHPDVVDNYRVAHGIYLQARSQRASTEDLREALLRYRSLFDELLQPDGNADASARGRHTSSDRRV